MRTNRFLATVFLLAVTFNILCASAVTAFPPPELSWTAEPWTGNEKPFGLARKRINALVASGAKPEALRRQYKVVAQRNYYNALAQFSYGFAALHAAAALPTQKAQRALLKDVPQSLNAPASPRSYEYDRLRFLVEAQTGAFNDLAKRSYIIDLGKRLSLKDPRDYYLTRQVLPLLMANDRSKYDVAVLAPQLAKQYQKGNPKDPVSYWLLAEAYANRVYETRNDRDAQTAIAYYRQYISMVPDSPTAREIKKIRIPLLQKKSYLSFHNQRE